MAEPEQDIVEHLCEVMHDAYEAAAVEAGWETQQRSRKPWVEVPEANKATMRVAVKAMLDDVAPRFLDLAVDAIHSEQRWQIELSGRGINTRLNQYGERTHRYVNSRLRTVADSLKVIWMQPFGKEPNDG